MTILATYTPGSIPRFLQHIRTANVPAKVTVAYLKSAGFKSSNDAALISIFKSLGFLDASGVPTQLWKQFRGGEQTGRAILGEALRKTYAGLFELHPDAQRKDDEAIGNWIRANSSMSQDGVNRAIRTFKTLCSEATFSGADAAVSAAPTSPAAAASSKVLPSLKTSGAPHLNINIELQIPASNDPDVYDSFFAAMKKHLFDES